MPAPTAETYQQIIEGMHTEPDFPNREHLRGLHAFPSHAAWDEPMITVFVLTDDTLATDAFKFPMTLRIGEAIERRFAEAGRDEYAHCRFVPEEAFVAGEVA